MVDIPDRLQCLFTSSVEHHGDSYLIEIPEEEIERGTVSDGETYRVAVFPHPTEDERERVSEGPRAGGEVTEEDRTPPVEEGEVREVTIEVLGDRGDGIAKVERGYVVIVPGTSPDDEVTVEIEQVRKNVAFARVIDEDVDTSFEERTINGLSGQPSINPDERP